MTVQHLNSVLCDDGLQQCLRSMAPPGICVPVARILQALLELLRGEAPHEASQDGLSCVSALTQR